MGSGAAAGYPIAETMDDDAANRAAEFARKAHGDAVERAGHLSTLLRRTAEALERTAAIAEEHARRHELAGERAGAASERAAAARASHAAGRARARADRAERAAALNADRRSPPLD
jgi:hypothetical protein